MDAQTGKNYLLALLRLSMSFIFLWAFFDKVFGLGFATKAGKAWIDGVSPTTGFLSNAVHGPFVNLFHSLAGQAWVDWAFMLGLLFVGTGLLLGTWMRLTAGAGTAMMLLMYLALMPSANNPVVDDHIIYALVLMFLSVFGAGDIFGLGNWWKSQSFVKRWPILG